MDVVQQMIQEEIRKLNASLNDKNRSLEARLEAQQQALREEHEQVRIKEDRLGGTRAVQDLLKLKDFASKITPVPLQDQLTVLERDQLDSFLKSPGIGMLFLSTAFYLAKIDLCGQLESAAAKALGSEVISTVSADVPVGTDVRRASDAALKTVTGEKAKGASLTTNLIELPQILKASKSFSQAHRCRAAAFIRRAVCLHLLHL